MLRVAINGYGNLGRGVEQAITKNADMEVARRLHPARPGHRHHPGGSRRPRR